LKVLHLNYSDVYGGAAKAAYRLHHGLIQHGINSKILVHKKFSDESLIIGPETKKEYYLNHLSYVVDRLPLSKYDINKNTLFSPGIIGSTSIIKRIEGVNPDIVHIHWINGGMVSVDNLLKIKYPTIWSFHDMWAFTGGCHYSEDCQKFVKSCEACHILNSKKKTDLSYRQFSKKRKVYSNSTNITGLGLSKWITEQAKESKLFGDLPVYNIPNTIDINIFKPLSRSNSRSLLGLPSDKNLILFGAMGGDSDPRKGFKYLHEAIKHYKKNDFEIVIIGGTENNGFDDISLKVNDLSRITNDKTLAQIYNACNVTVIPSVQENLSNMILESLSCGTPVVAFNIGGNSDMIKHNVNGYLANIRAKSLLEGIVHLLRSTKKESDKISIMARKTVIDKFSYDSVVPRYISLYSKILKA